MFEVNRTSSVLCCLEYITLKMAFQAIFTKLRFCATEMRRVSFCNVICGIFAPTFISGVSVPAIVFLQFSKIYVFAHLCIKGYVKRHKTLLQNVRVCATM